ncbi:MAG: hypothetical protein IKL68_01315 [Clostridia bacterium]|nr:hypothetical protein [Clostridia bacterium]
MIDSNIDVDIIDETLLYICIDGKREHISVDNARIKYAKNKQVLSMIDDVLARYKENSEPLAPAKEEVVPVTESPKNEPTLKDLNDAPLEDIEIDLGEVVPKKEVEPTLEDLNSKPLEAAKKDVKQTVLPKKDLPLEDLNSTPLGTIDEAMFAIIYKKYNPRIRETFLTDSPSFLDVEKLARRDKPLEQVK